MKKKEENEKKPREAGKQRFNVIDILIVVLVIACIVAIVLRFTVLDRIQGAHSLDEYYITFTVSSLSYSQLQAITLAVDEADDKENWVYLSDSKTKVGTLTSLGEQNKETLVFVNADGKTITAAYSDSAPDEGVRWTLTGMILCHGIYSTEGGFLLNGKEYLGANSTLDVQTKYADFTLFVTGIEKSLETNS